MKKCLFFILVLITHTGIYAQKAKAVNVKKMSEYAISGVIEGHVDGDTVYMCRLNGLYLVPEDTTIIANGEFHFKGSTDMAKLRCIVASMNKNPIIFPFVLSNEKSRMKVMRDVRMSTVTGSYDNDLWLEYNKHLQEMHNKLVHCGKNVKGRSLTMAERDSIRKEENDYHREDSVYTVKFIIDKLPSGTSDVLLEMIMPLNENTMQVILGKMRWICPEDALYLSLMRQKEAAKETAVGCRYIDFVLNTPEGNPVKLSDYVRKSKVTMIDFWASWCGPCRREMPNVIKAYNEYKDKGFAVIGVSLDSNKEAWEDAVRELGISWPQMSDLKGWQSAVAALYNVRSIPATVLIDQDGKIIAKDLRGEELGAKLKEIFK